MMRTFTTRDGSIWRPSYLTSIDSKTCIGCGRCFKVCSRDVMHLHGVDDAGEILGPCDDEDDDFDGELNRMIMV
ncbi:MAG: ferredoxin III, nif-specific, partial [Mesorhizobium sp.]